ncbi:hypothetical protein D083_1736 [Dickeya solani RNS 08.23.3.1.A]|nr:hypothetical protein D083_1736 [Dickeya solani RNS 08.23.3.1.A]
MQIARLCKFCIYRRRFLRLALKNCIALNKGSTRTITVQINAVRYFFIH